MKTKGGEGSEEKFLVNEIAKQDSARTAEPAGMNEVDQRQAAKELFDITASDIKDYNPQDLIDRSYVSNIEAQSLVSVAQNFERAGESEKALLLYQRALDTFESGHINAWHTEQTILQALETVEGIARLGGDKERAFARLLGICRKTLSAEVIAKVARGKDQESRDQLNARNIKPDWKTMPFPEKITDLIDLLPDSPVVSSDGISEELRRLRNNVISGITHVATNTVRGISHVAVSAHAFGMHKEAEAFLKAAFLIAQADSMNIKQVMQGDLSVPNEKARYLPLCGEDIADALSRMGRLQEGAELYLDVGGNISIWNVSRIIPKLLEANPQDPRILALTKRYLGASDFLKKDMSVSNARVLIALILNKHYGFAESGIETKLLGEASEDSE